MFDVNDDAKGGFQRVEILAGPGRRRRWSAEEPVSGWRPPILDGVIGVLRDQITGQKCANYLREAGYPT